MKRGTAYLMGGVGLVPGSCAVSRRGTKRTMKCATHDEAEAEQRDTPWHGATEETPHGHGMPRAQWALTRSTLSHENGRGWRTIGCG